MANLIHNEQTKLKATYFNNTAVGVLIGGFLPLGFSGAASGWFGFGALMLGICGSFLLHIFAARGLEELKE